jgi:hypothetical protein
MKRILLSILLIGSMVSSKGQILISNNFDGYNGLLSTVAPGWYYSFNDSAAATRSYYSSAGTCGVTCPAYKFGHDTVTVITPSFVNADSIQFYLKGNGTSHVENHLTIYESVDSVNWIQTYDIDSISASATTYTLLLGIYTTNVKFVYYKDSLGYNVGLDDIYIFRGPLSIGINEISKNAVSVYPNPSSGLININVGNATLENATVTVTNILGKVTNTFSYNKLFGRNTIDLSSLEQGIYMVRVKSSDTDTLQRILIKR